LTTSTLHSSEVKAPQCAKCSIKPCYHNLKTDRPVFCPMNMYPEIIERAIIEYQNEFVKRVHFLATLIEKEGYCVWPRIRETIELCRRLGVNKVGIAFCIGLSEEAYRLQKILENWGLNVYSVVCKYGSVDKTFIGIDEKDKLEPGVHEAMCNPVAQALILNHVGTELNIVVGLCVGHDTIFLRYSKAPVVYLIAKDRTTGHNPAAPLYASNYFSKRILP